MLRQNTVHTYNYVAVCDSGNYFEAPIDQVDVVGKICDRAVSMVTKKFNRKNKKTFFDILEKNGWFVKHGGGKFKCPVCTDIMTRDEFTTCNGNVEVVMQQRELVKKEKVEKRKKEKMEKNKKTDANTDGTKEKTDTTKK